MDAQPHTFKGVHDYMDALFAGRSPSSDEIIDAKKQYWKAYNSDLIKRRRKKNSEFTIAFNKKELKLIYLRKAKEKSVTEYLQKVVLTHLNDNTSINKFIDTSIIEQQLFLIAEYMQDLLDIETSINPKNFAQLESKINHLQNLIESRFDHQE